MATTYTANYNLGKQIEDKNDTFLMSVITDNADKIDAALSSHELDTNNPHDVTKTQIGLSNVDNTSDLDKPISTLTQTALNLKADNLDLTTHTNNTSNPHGVTKSQIGLGNVDNTSDLDKPVSTATQTALDAKASTTTLTAHTGNADIHVTAADKTAWNLMPKSKSETMDNRGYQDFVIPILNIASTYTNEYFYGQIYLKRTNGASQQMTIINLMCGKSSNEEKAVYYMDKSHMWAAIKPCSFTYNSKKMFGIHVKIPSSDYNMLRVDARTTTDFGSITPVYIYNNNTSAVLNAEIYNSLSFFDGYNRSMHFYEIPKVIKTDGTETKLLSFSSVPATLTSSGTVGDIAYDTSYMYICTATNTWKKIPLGTAHEDNTDIHVTSADKAAWNGKVSYTAVPASATATGTKGDIAYDSGYMYVCTATNTWKRTALTTW